MKILITGSNGFLAKNLIIRLKENNYQNILKYKKNQSLKKLNHYIQNCDIIFHLAAINRSSNLKEFQNINFNLTKYICDKAALKKTKTPIIFSSSIQALKKNIYGLSKKNAEDYLIRYQNKTRSNIYIFQLPNIFGKWSRPNYNSVVATFCYNISRRKKIEIYDQSELLSLIYIDDVIDQFLNIIKRKKTTSGYQNIKKIKKIKISQIVDKLIEFRDSDMSLRYPKNDFNFKLYSTYCSFLPRKKFSYKLKSNRDTRGNFVEVTKNSVGQHSYFTAYPGVTRGGHYHHTKVEKFLILKGHAEFKFENISSKKRFKLRVKSNDNTVVLSIPGWAHSITNVGKDEMIVFLWSNEVYNPKKPDTYFTESKYL